MTDYPPDMQMDMDATSEMVRQFEDLTPRVTLRFPPGFEPEHPEKPLIVVIATPFDGNRSKNMLDMLLVNSAIAGLESFTFMSEVWMMKSTPAAEAAYVAMCTEHGTQNLSLKKMPQKFVDDAVLIVYESRDGTKLMARNRLKTVPTRIAAAGRKPTEWECMEPAKQQGRFVNVFSRVESGKYKPFSSDDKSAFLQMIQRLDAGNN